MRRTQKHRRRSPLELLADDTGSTEAMEFVLVFPVMLTILTVIIQAALIWVAYLVVQYASFNAARSAIVWVPAEIAGTGLFAEEPQNEVGTGILPSKKLSKIEEAAALSCLAITPAIYPLEFLERPYFSAPTSPVRISVNPIDLAMRWALSQVLTSVELDKSSYAEDDSISVTVTHRLVLRVPIAAKLLGEPFLGLLNDQLAQFDELKPFLPPDVKNMVDGKADAVQSRLPYVKTISVTTTLLNQGRIRGPQP